MDAVYMLNYIERIKQRAEQKEKKDLHLLC